MKDNDGNDVVGTNNDPEALLARYGGHLDGLDLSKVKKQEVLSTYWQIMVAFVDLGFSLKAGDKLTPKCDLRVEDVLHYLHLEETAHETGASEKP